MRVAIVTGAARNIGFAVASALVDAGWRVALTGRDEQTLHVAAKRLANPDVVMTVPMNVRDESDVIAATDAVIQRWGRIDALVNNAGIRCHGAIDSTALDDWNAVLETVLTGAFLTTRAVLPHMQERSWGRIVNIAGLSGQSGAAHRAPVIAAKSGLVGLTKATAHEAAPSGITVNAVSPGFISTERPVGLGDESIAAQHYQSFATSSPVGRPGTAEEVGQLCAFLCSDAAGYITGQVYSINGGAYM